MFSCYLCQILTLPSKSHSIRDRFEKIFFFLNLASIRWYRQTTDMIVQLGLSNYYSLYCSLKCACIGRHTSLCDTDSESLSKGV